MYKELEGLVVQKRGNSLANGTGAEASKTVWPEQGSERIAPRAWSGTFAYKNRAPGWILLFPSSDTARGGGHAGDLALFTLGRDS